MAFTEEDGVLLGSNTVICSKAAIASEKKTAQLHKFERPPINLYPDSDETELIRSLPDLVEFNAEHNPDHLFCIQARRNLEAYPLKLTNVEIRNAIGHCAMWLEQNITELHLPFVSGSGAVTKGQPVALLMESDIGLWIHILALIGLGVPVLLLSARLSSTAVQHLCKDTGTAAIIASSRLHNTAQKALDSGQPLYLAQSLEEIIRRRALVEKSICHENHYIDSSDRNVLILHSSGTTGLPKPIYVSHRHLLCFADCHAFISEAQAQGCNVSTLPLYHGFGLVAPALAMGVGKTLCLPATSIVPNATSTIRLIKAVNATSLMSVPFILEEITLMPGPNAINALARLDFVAFGGGILKDSVGNMLSAKGVRLLNHYGATESGPLSPIFVPGPDYDWRFFRLRKDTKLRVEEVHPQGKERRFKLTTFPFGWHTPFEIQDRLVCSPSHPTTDFNVEGRNDDLIVLGTGEKVQPQILENMLSSSGYVKTAIAFGDNQFEIGVIVEPSLGTLGSEREFKELIWPIVVQAGLIMDEFAKISSIEAIIVVPPGARLPRTDKGSIARREVYSLFEKEISQAYSRLENSAIGTKVRPLNSTTLEKGLAELIQDCMSWKAPPSNNDDFFELGMDSLQASRLRRHLLSVIIDDKPAISIITRNFVYLYPSVTRMAEAFRNGPSMVSDFATEVQRHLAQYTLPTKEKKKVVLITGTTGSLGAHCLSHFAGQADVAKVICLNRESLDSGAIRQETSFKAKQITLHDEAWTKIQIFQTNSALSQLGLTESDYMNLRDTVTHIFHNAWPMDFRMQLSSFGAQFQVLRNIISFAQEIASTRPLAKPRLLFVSSIATIGRYVNVCARRIVPEEPVEFLDCVNEIGYAQAKLVCEKMIENAAASGLDASIVRLGQISGSALSGFWNTTEHFAALMKSSQLIRALPQLHGTLAWIPVNDAATVASQLLFSTEPLAPVNHIENPVRQSWSDSLSVIAAELGINELLPLDAWIDKVCEAAGDSSRANPAKRLEHFFRTDFERMACGQVIMGTDKARQASTTLRNMDAVPPEVILSHIRYWRSVNFLD